MNKCLVEQWDAKTCRVNKRHPNAALINVGISEKYTEAERAMLNGDDPLSRNSVKTLGEMINAEKTRLKSAIKIATYNHILALENDLKEFYPSLNIPTKSINAIWLNSFVGKLMNIPNGDTTISKKVKLLQNLIKTNNGQLTESAASFKHKAFKSVKQKLTREEFDRISGAVLAEGSLQERN